MKLFKNKVVLSLIVFAVICILKSGSASAATLTVVSGTDSINQNGQCQLSEAIQNINEQAATNTDCIAGNSISDTIVIPSGTITLSSDMTFLEKNVKIVGSGIGSSIISGSNLHKGIICFNNIDLQLEAFTVTQMSQFAIKCESLNSAILNSIDMNESGIGALIGASTIVIDESRFHHNKGHEFFGNADVTGLIIKIIPTSSVENEISLSLSDTKIYNNTAEDAPLAFSGLYVRYETTYNSQIITNAPDIEISRTNVFDNISETATGVYISGDNGPFTAVPIIFRMDATTVNNNSVIVQTPQVVTPGFLNFTVSPYLAGLNITGNLASGQNITNVTVAFNSVIAPVGDNRIAIAGFQGSLGINSADLSILSSTIVGNNVIQPDSQESVGSFFVNKIDASFDNGFTVNNVLNGSSATNTLVASNQTNSVTKNCIGLITNIFENIDPVDVTPKNLGYNLSDDQSCTGYTYSANLYDTIEHQVKDNGGPVPTIALLPGSPAINSGGQVQGVTTDARGVARQGYYSVGAYQGLLAASTTTPGLADTGALAISTTLLLGILISVTIYTFIDYKKHKAPLRAIDPTVRYTYTHHIRVVSIPLLKYRLSFRFSRNVQDPDGVHKF